MAIVHLDMQLKRSTYEVLQILIISLTDKTYLRDLFDKTIFNDVKELDYPLFKGLFWVRLLPSIWQTKMSFIFLLLIYIIIYCVAWKKSHKNVIDSTISLFFRDIPLLVSLFFVTLPKEIKMVAI